MDRSSLRFRETVKVQNVIDRGRQRAQSSLNMLHPLAALRIQCGVRQQPGKKFETSKRIADFMRQHRRHFGKCLLPAQLALRVFEFTVQPLNLPAQHRVRCSREPAA